ncbi:MFS transporter [Metabacillus indicus]|uniref:MFS transporter n=1 Tax=Metabacillus indicus TaxID=246786 RepID=UPI002A091227|nr:MFS transporter [Metabacillus indicus]MDX8291596.1 MFS transporter [Metabacillus indicus]
MKPVKLLFYNQLLSVFSSTFGTFLLSWILYEETGSKLAMGTLWLVSISGQLIVQFIAGPYIDRFKRTTVMKVSEALRAFVYLLLLLFFTVGFHEAALLYAAAFLTSITAYDPAAAALVPKLVQKEILVKVNAGISGGVQLMRFLALPAAGFLVSVLDEKSSLILVVSAFSVSFIMIGFLIEKPGEFEGKASWIKKFKEGAHIYRKHKVLLFLGGLVSITSFGVFAAQTMYIPFVSEVLGGSSFEYGLFAASFPLGYIAGSFAASRIKVKDTSIYQIMMLALFIGGSTYLALGAAKTLAAAMIIEIAAGAAMPFWNVYSTTLYQKLVPQSILGQVFSVRFLLTKAAAPLGIVYGTACASRLGIEILFLSIGAIICTVSGGGLLFFAFRRRSSVFQLK